MLALLPLAVFAAIHRFGERSLYPGAVYLSAVQAAHCLQTRRVRIQVHKGEVFHLLDAVYLSELREDLLQLPLTRVERQFAQKNDFNVSHLVPWHLHLGHCPVDAQVPAPEEEGPARELLAGPDSVSVR